MFCSVVLYTSPRRMVFISTSFVHNFSFRYSIAVCGFIVVPQVKISTAA